MNAASADLDDLDTLVAAAQGGDRDALQGVCRRLQDPMYRLALRFTGNPTDAEDAA